MENTETKLNVKDIVKDNTVHFHHYRADHLYYDVIVNGETYIFPVPISDIGEATFNHIEKAMLLMRYIRIALNDGTFVKI